MILVTGATGFIGRHLVRSLVADGESVRALVRPDADTAVLPAAVELFVGDITDGKSLAGVADGCDVVLHLAGDYRGSDAEMERMHAHGTANLLAVCPEDTRVVLLSSTSVYGWERDWPADEGTPTRPVVAYGRAKVEAERLVLARGPLGAVARSTIVYGPDDDGGMLTRAERLLRAGWRWFPGTGSNRIHLLHVDDLVRGLTVLLRGGSGVYLFAGPTPTTIREVLTTLAAAVDAPGPRFIGAERGLRVAARLTDAALGERSPLDEHAVDVLTRDRAFAPRRSTSELGWEPRVSLQDGIATLARPFVPAAVPGPEWQRFIDDHDEGLGSVYERFVLSDVIDAAMKRCGADSVLHAPMFGMTGVPGLDLIFQARRGIDVGLADTDRDRLDAVVDLWRELGCEPRSTHLLPWPDVSGWADACPQRYDLVVSFAALWWCPDPESVLAAQAKWAGKGVLLCVPNRNVFMRVRARFWHREMFEHLDRSVLDRDVVERMAERVGLRVVDTGLFDLPPFPDIAISVKQLVPALGRRAEQERASGADEGWRWDVVPHLKGEDPEMEQRITRLRSVLEERFIGRERFSSRLAHHRYWLLVPR